MKAKIFATEPVWEMSQCMLYDAVISRYLEEDIFTLDDIDRTFQSNNFIKLKFSERHLLSDRGADITVTPYAAGHVLGGALWKITKESEDIIYAVDWNHKSELHLNYGEPDVFQRMSLLITDSFSARSELAKRKDRTRELIATIEGTLREGGNVLLPIDCAGRVLEVGEPNYSSVLWIEGTLAIGCAGGVLEVAALLDAHPTLLESGLTYLPPCLPTYLPSYLPTCPPARPPTHPPAAALPLSLAPSLPTFAVQVAMLLDAHWGKQAGMRIYPLVMLSHVATCVLSSAKVKTEWMSDSIKQSFGQNLKALEFKNLKVFNTLEEMERHQVRQQCWCSSAGAAVLVQCWNTALSSA
jgi:Cft2 family RNA processing exonuclease